MTKAKKYAPKAIAVLLSLVIVCSVIGVAAYTAGAKSGGNNAATSASEDKKSESSKSDDGELSKEETVYVIADADGKAKKVIVSDWLKNPDGLKKINDKTDLKDIENLKGDETYTLDKDNLCVWDAEGNDIYYQGTSDKDIPVDLSVSYKLDGKTVSADELAGKSGKVTIRFDYKNNQYENVKIDGKTEKIYVPFVMLTGMILDNDKFTNVQVSNGKVINDGNHTIVAGFALPGLSDDLDIDTDEVDIPDYVEITANVEDFELTTTLTVATNEVFSDVDFSDLDDKIDELDEKLDELTDATDKLIDGSSQLYKGIDTLLKKSDTLISGVKSLANGAKQLANGASNLDKGVGKLNKGTKSLSKGAVSLDGGAEQLQSGIKQLSDGLGTLSSNSASLRTGAKKVFDSLLTTADTQLAAAGITADKLTVENYSAVLAKVQKSLGKDEVSKLAYNTAYETVSSTVRAQESLIKGQVEAAVKQQVLEGVLAKSGLGLTADKYTAAVAAGQIDETVQAQINGAVEQQMNSETIKTTISTKTEEQIKSLIDTNMKSDEVTKQINAAVEKAAAGSTSIAALKTQLDSYNTFYQGINSYTSGVDSANTGAKKLVTGAGSLKSGTKELSKGAKSLNKGTKVLKAGSEKLASGSKQLSAGAQKLVDNMPQLVDGIKKLDNGALKLNKGMKTYKQQGVQKIVDAVNGDAKTLVNRLKAISKVSSNYKSFSGINSKMDGKVDFIYKTDSIENK